LVGDHGGLFGKYGRLVGEDDGLEGCEDVGIAGRMVGWLGRMSC
jgi:hypothetical protein